MRYTRSSTMSSFFGPEREGTQLLVESIGPTKSHQTFIKTFRPRLPQQMSSSAIFAHLKHHLLIPGTSQHAFCPRRWISQFAPDTPGSPSSDQVKSLTTAGFPRDLEAKAVVIIKSSMAQPLFSYFCIFFVLKSCRPRDSAFWVLGAMFKYPISIWQFYVGIKGYLDEDIMVNCHWSSVRKPNNMICTTIHAAG